MLNVFHISDLHFTSKPTGQLRDAAQASVRSILELASALKADGTLGAKPCVFVTGDIVQSGEINADTSSDFDELQTVLLKPLMGVLGIGPDRVYLVPGNHELNRAAIAEGDRLIQGQYATQKICEADIAGDLQKKLSSFFQFVEREGYQSLTAAEPRLATFSCDGQQIVCFNGMAGSYSRPGYGDKGELFVLSSELTGIFAAIQKNAVVLTHHPLSWFADNCGTDLKEFFSTRQCRVFTGHIHDRGIDCTETAKGEFVTVQAGASGEVGTSNQVAVAWIPTSNSVAVRHYSLDPRVGGFALTPAADTKVAPARARQFLERSEAFFDPKIINEAADAAKELSDAELTIASGRGALAFVPPDITRFPADQFSGQRTNIEAFEADTNNRVISGDELSGKSSLLQYLSARRNGSDLGGDRKVSMVLDFRLLEANHDIYESITKRLTS